MPRNATAAVTGIDGRRGARSTARQQDDQEPGTGEREHGRDRQPVDVRA